MWVKCRRLGQRSSRWRRRGLSCALATFRRWRWWKRTGSGNSNGRTRSVERLTDLRVQAGRNEGGHGGGSVTRRRVGSNHRWREIHVVLLLLLMMMMMIPASRERHHRRIRISVRIGKRLRNHPVGHVEATGLTAHVWGRRRREITAITTAISTDAARLWPYPAISTTTATAVVVTAAASTTATATTSSSVVAVARSAAMDRVAMTAATATLAGRDGAVNGRGRCRGGLVRIPFGVPVLERDVDERILISSVFMRVTFVKL